MASVKHISWRNGRPRFQPGVSLRRLGYRGKDLRHDNGQWFTRKEAEVASSDICRELAKEPGIRAQNGLLDPKPKKARLTNEKGFVYFLVSGEAIKIGFSKSPIARAAGLLTAMSQGIDAMAFVPGTEREERRVHAILEAHRGRGEWFKRHPAVLRVMVRSITFGKILLADDEISRVRLDVSQKCVIVAGDDAQRLD